MIKRDRYSSISLDLLLQYRTVLSRRTDTSGATSWTARVVGLPWCEATGSTRTEALRRVREMASAASPARAARKVRERRPGGRLEAEPYPGQQQAATEGSQTLDA